jgi:hypothetical protein
MNKKRLGGEKLKLNGKKRCRRREHDLFTA